LNQPVQGLVVREQSGFFTVEVADGRLYTCRLRGRLLEDAQSSDIAAIGDQVNISTADDGTGAIEEVLPRKSALSRAVRTTGVRGAGQAEREQVIIANADQAIFVFAATQPTPNFKLLDRFLVAGEASDIEHLIIVVNKIDLESQDIVTKRFEPYVKMGYPILYTSAILEQGVMDLRDLLKDRISVFTGPSGVGKSSLLNQIQPDLGRAVKAVSANSGEGIHTTRDSALIKLENGGYIADTPGIRSLTVWDVEPDELDAYFVDIAAHLHECRFADCTHTNEPRCGVRAAVEAGAISEHRYRNYLDLRDELKETYVVY